MPDDGSRIPYAKWRYLDDGATCEHDVVPLLLIACHVSDVVTQPTLEVTVLLKALLVQIADQRLRFRPGSRTDEGLIRRPALRLGRNAGAGSDEFLREFESALFEARNTPREVIDESIQFGVRNRAVYPAILFRGVGIEVIGAANDLQRTRAAGQRGKPFGRTTAGNHGHANFDLREHGLFLRRETDVACQCQLRAVAAGTTTKLGHANHTRLGEAGDELGPRAELSRAGLVRNHFAALEVVVRNEIVGVGALEHDHFQVTVGVDPVHQDIEFREHLRVVQVDRRVLDDYAPVGGGHFINRQAVLVGSHVFLQEFYS